MATVKLSQTLRDEYENLFNGNIWDGSIYRKVLQIQHSISMEGNYMSIGKDSRLNAQHPFKN